MSSRVLYITHRVPFPPDKGDRIRNFHLLRQLARHHTVDLACLADEPVSDGTRTTLGELCGRVSIVPVSRFGRLAQAGRSLVCGRSLSEGAFWSSELQRIIQAWHREKPYGAAIISASSLVPYLRTTSFAKVPAFVDVVDLDSQKWCDFAATASWPKSWLYRWEGARVRSVEADLPKWAEAATLVSRAEADLFDTVAGAGSATVATNGVDLEYFQPSDVPTQRACAFVGALDYLPNVDAAIWFADEVWPQLRAKHPDAEYWLIGRKPTPAVQVLAARPGIRLIGQVPDVRPHLAAAAVAIVPMRLSRGLQNKVLEALAMAKATVVAPPALAALKTVLGTHLLSAETAREWVEAVSGLFDNPARRRELGLAGRQFVEEHHHWETCLRPLTDRIQAAICKRDAFSLAN